VGKQPIVQSNDLANLIAQTPPGTSTRLLVWRSGKEKEVTVRVEELRDTDARADRRHPKTTDDGGKLGLEVRPLTPDEKRSVDTDGNVVVVDATGPAQRAGLQPGDIILAVNDHTVRDVKDLRSASEKLHPGDAAALLVEREGNQIFVPVRIAQAG